MANKLILLISLLCFTQDLLAYVENNVILKGKLIQFDEKVAILEINKNEVRVPAPSVKMMDYRPGQNVVVFVDFHDLIQLNQKQPEAKGIIPKSKPAETGDSPKK